MADGLYKMILCHNNEELLKIAKDMQGYARKELKSLRELNPGHISNELQPQLQFYKDMILISSAYLTNIKEWP